MTKAGYSSITGSTRIAGLFGCPISHTISPAMHNAAFRHLGINVIYLPFLITPENLKAAVRSLPVLGFAGVNITIPHKQKVMRYLDKIMPSAKSIGAVNTICIKKDTLIGYNTDGLGFVRSVQDDLNWPLKGRRMLLLGAGGAGRAIAVQSAISGIKRIYIADKQYSRARKLAEDVPGRRAESVKDVKGAVSEADIIVNATPVGMHESDPPSIPPEWIPAGRLVYDVIYNPKRTKLLSQVRGCRTVNGTGMLLHQGAAAFEIWTGRKAPLGIMRKAVGL